jgi:type II secretory pathway pseudopilin PulG
MILVVAIALLLAVLAQVRERRRRQAMFQARVAQLQLEILANQMARLEIEAVIESERKLHPERELEVLKRGVEDRKAIQDEGKRLRRKLSQLRP